MSHPQRFSVTETLKSKIQEMLGDMATAEDAEKAYDYFTDRFDFNPGCESAEDFLYKFGYPDGEVTLEVEHDRGLFNKVWAEMYKEVFGVEV